MRTVIVGTVLAGALLLAACSSGDTLTDAESVWCPEHQSAVDSARRDLGLSDATQMWYESQGVTFNEAGETEPSDNLTRAMAKIDEIRAEGTEASIQFWDTMMADWLEHPNYIRACKAAYELR